MKALFPFLLLLGYSSFGQTSQGSINVKDYGALNDGKSHPLKSKFKSFTEARSTYPSTTNMEAEINDMAFEKAKTFALSSISTTKRIYFPAGTYFTSHSLYVGNGDGATSLEITGEETYSYDVNNAAIKGAVIYCTSKTEPCLIIQGARNTLIKGLRIIGQNSAAVSEYSRDCIDASKYLVRGIDDSKKSIYAGILIDPDRTKMSSSVVRIESCYISEWVYGILGMSQSNGDFFGFTNNYIRVCLYGITMAGGQARTTNILYNQLNQCYTSISTENRGSGYGRVSLVQGNHFAGFQIFDIPSSEWNGPLTIQANYAEGLFQIGSIGNGGMDASGVTFSGNDFNFNHRMIGVSPLYIITSSTSLHGVRFKNCRFRGWSFNIKAEHKVNFEDDCQFTFEWSDNVYGRVLPLKDDLWKNMAAIGGFYAPGKRVKECAFAIEQKQYQKSYEGDVSALTVASTAFIFNEEGLGLKGITLKFKLKNENLTLVNAGDIFYNGAGYGFLVIKKNETALFTAILLNGYKLSTNSMDVEEYLFDLSSLNKGTTTVYKVR